MVIMNNCFTFKRKQTPKTKNIFKKEIFVFLFYSNQKFL